MSPNRKKIIFRIRNHGVTLVELLVALTVLAILSTAIAVLLVGAGNTNTYVNNETDAMAQIENAYRRILHNVRTAQAIASPLDAIVHNNPAKGAADISVTTQNDGTDGYASGATVAYYILNGNLVEEDQRYGTNILVTGVKLFSVQRVSTSATPTQLIITVTSNTTPPVTRTVTVMCRNI